MSKIDVYLEKEIYTAGEKVKGTLYIDQNVHIDIEGILLLARGLAILNTNPPCEEEHLNVNLQIATRGNKKKITLVNGLHSFDFEFQLPEKLPSSLEKPMGKIIYFIEVIIQKIVEHKIRKKFRVFGKVDLELAEKLNHKHSVSRVKTIGLGQSQQQQSGTVLIDLTLNKRFFSPGEEIYVQAKLENNRDTIIGDFSLVLVEHVVFNALHNKLFSINDVAKATYEDVIKAKSVCIWNCKLTIPADKVSTTINGESKLIKVSYYITVSNLLGNGYLNDNLIIPIYIASSDSTTSK